MIRGYNCLINCSLQFLGAIRISGMGRNKLLSTSVAAVSSEVDVKSKSKYGGRHVVTLVPGDGVGPELAVCVKEVFSLLPRIPCVVQWMVRELSVGITPLSVYFFWSLEDSFQIEKDKEMKIKVNAPVDFEEISMSGLLSQKDCLEEAITSIRRNGIGLCGTLRTPLGDVTQRSLNVQLRVSLDLFANVVLCRSLPNVPTRHKDLNIAIIRENTEGEYSGLEHESVSGVVEGLKIITRDKSSRIAKYAFDYAVRHDRKKVTAIHKANIMKLSDGLFLKECSAISKMYPNIEFNSMIIDNCCMQMVSNPQQFDVMVLPNLYGNIVSNVGAGLVGGAGVVQGMNVGWNYVVFEQGARHAFTSKAAQNVANPTGVLLSSVDLLKHLGMHSQAEQIKDSVMKTLRDGKFCTQDVGGSASTSDYLKSVISNLN